MQDLTGKSCDWFNERHYSPCKKALFNIVSPKIMLKLFYCLSAVKKLIRITDENPFGIFCEYLTNDVIINYLVRYCLLNTGCNQLLFIVGYYQSMF